MQSLLLQTAEGSVGPTHTGCETKTAGDDGGNLKRATE